MNLKNKRGKGIIVENEVGKLEGVPAVEKTIEEYTPEATAEEGVTARTKDFFGVEVQYLDGKDCGDRCIMDESTQIAYNGPIPVFADCNGKTSIGSASLYVENKCLKADLFLDYHTPERLSMENGVELFPSFVGWTDRIDSGKIKNCRVRGIALTTAKNVDTRIGPLK
jgi:hypothetical protein